MLPFPDGDARRHKDLSWFGQEKALRPAREGSLYYLAPKCLYWGKYKCGVEWSMETLLRVGVVLRDVCSFLGLPFSLHACTSWRLIRQSGGSAVSRRPTLPQEGNMSGRGSDAM